MSVHYECVRDPHTRASIVTRVDATRVASARHVGGPVDLDQLLVRVGLHNLYPDVPYLGWGKMDDSSVQLARYLLRDTLPGPLPGVKMAWEFAREFIAIVYADAWCVRQADIMLWLKGYCTDEPTACVWQIMASGGNS